MKRCQAYIFELRPNGGRIRLMRRFAGCVRFVYNKALGLQKERYEKGEKRYSYPELCKQLTLWRHDSETAWLADVSSQPLQQKERCWLSIQETPASRVPKKHAGIGLKRTGLPKLCLNVSDVVMKTMRIG